MNPISRALQDSILSEPVAYKNLAMFPLLREKSGEPDYLVLDEALALNKVRITEVSEQGSVPEIELTNEADKPVLLIDGEELIGAKQNRIVNLSILAPALATIVIPVSCVEAGRWRHISERFLGSTRAFYAEARAKKAAHVSESLCTEFKRAANQGEIWDDIAAKSARMGAYSPTAAMADIFEQNQQLLDGFLKAFQPIAHQAGAIFAINGQVKGLDLFDHPATLGKLLPKLAQSYALDALDEGAGEMPLAAMDSSCDFLAKVASADQQTFPAVGLGEDVRLNGENICGGALVADGRLVHLCAFRLGQDARDGFRSSRAARIHAASSRMRAYR